MAATIVQILEGLEARLDTVSGLRVREFAPGTPIFPAAFPLLPGFEYRRTMSRGTYEIPFRIAVLVGAGYDRAGQRKLAGYADQTGSTSIRAALEGDKTLGGVVADLIVDDFDAEGLGRAGFVEFYGGVINLRVFASGA